MIRDVEAWRRWEAQWQRATRPQPEENIRIFWTLLEMARAAGAENRPMGYQTRAARDGPRGRRLAAGKSPGGH